MSENDRMERAKRIRRMREGQREPEDDDDRAGESATTNDTAGPDADQASTGTSGETASTDGGAAATPTERPAEDHADSVGDDDDSGTDVDETDGQFGTPGGTRAEIPSTEEMEAAMEQTMAQTETVSEAETSDEGEADGEAEASPAGAAGPTAGVSEEAETTSQEPDTRVLEFTLDDEQYCLDIQYIEEIVKHTAITRVPNTPEFVEGVVDLRGQITTILNPKVTIGKRNQAAGDLIVVFDSEAFEDQGHIGWVVDDVKQVSPVRDNEVNTPPMDDDHVNGVIDREEDDEFVIWTSPDLALEDAD